MFGVNIEFVFSFHLIFCVFYIISEYNNKNNNNMHFLCVFFLSTSKLYFYNEVFVNHFIIFILFNAGFILLLLIFQNVLKC